jgi:prepilin-type processing-associated H-X9-DG protein
MRMTGKRRKNRQPWGFTLAEMIIVAGIVSAIPSAKYAQVKAKANQTVEVSNLRQVGQLLTMYHLDNGHYPKAAFYPKDPLAGNDSIRVLLAGKSKSSGAALPSRGLPGGLGGRIAGAAGGGTGSLFVSNGVPADLQKKGLTYVYNDAIAGKKSIASPSKTWVLIDMTCVSPKVAPPYRGGYNVLFADGRVITTKSLPPSIRKLRQQVGR